MLLAAVPVALAAPPGQDDLDWLKTIAFAAHQTDYSGTFVYQYGDHVETSRITHILDRDGEHGRLESMDGVPREIIYHNDRVWSNSDERKVGVENRQGRTAFPALLPLQLLLLSENYQIAKAEEVRVAGFHTRSFVFQPKDNLRYTHKMWAHNDSGLLLKAAVLDGSGRVIEQYAFTQLTIGGNIDRSWIVPDKPAIVPDKQVIVLGKPASVPGKPATSFHAQHPIFAHPLKAEKTISASVWRIDSMPAGFIKTTEIRRPLSGRKASVTQMVFSDGLAGISVFIEAVADNPEANTGLSSRGAIQAYSKVSGEYRVTVVGEVPPRTVMQIADSVRYKGQ